MLFRPIFAPVSDLSRHAAALPGGGRPAFAARLRMALWLLLFGLLAGCGGGTSVMPGDDTALRPLPASLEEQASEIRELAKMPPALSVGDVFTYDNPAVSWEIVGIDDDGLLHWRSDNGDEQTTSNNPLLPALEWHSEFGGSGRRVISDMSRPFFPLWSGKRITFTSTVNTDTPPYAWEFDWYCAVVKLTVIDTPMGEIDAYQIDCGRDEEHELTFYYSPRVGHYVRMEVSSNTGGRPTVRQMTQFARGHLQARLVAGTVDAEELEESPILMAGPESAAGMADGEMPAGQVYPDQMTPPDDAAVTGTPSGMAGMRPVIEPVRNGTGTAAGEGTAPDDTMQMEIVVTEETAGDDGQAMALLAAAVDEATAGEPMPVASAAAAPTTPAPAPAPAPNPAASGMIGMHLASFQVQGNAEKGWRQIQDANRDLLSATAPVIRKAEVPGKGTFYRLYAGPVASMGDARAICQALKSRGAYCRATDLPPG